MKDIKLERLKEVILDKGWTQKRIAEESGYTQQYISNLLNGVRPIGEECAKSISKVLDIDPDYILGKTDYKSKEDYLLKSINYHSDLESKFLELIEVLQTFVYLEPYTIEKRIIKKDNHLNELENIMISRSQAYKLVSPYGEQLLTEMEI